MKKITIISLSLILINCGSIVTRENAVHDCPRFYNVRCAGINNELDYPIEYVGREVGEICGGPVLGCVLDKVIYQWQKDWMVTAHERCHNYCKKYSDGVIHVPPKRVIPKPYINGNWVSPLNKTTEIN